MTPRKKVKRTIAASTAHLQPPTVSARGRKRPSTGCSGITTSPPSGATNDARVCEFCHIAAGVCAIQSCSACCRIYHPKCIANHYKPQCTSDAPIALQLEVQRQSASAHNSPTMFQCMSCFAALVESVRTGGFAWDCDCASCVAPEKLAAYRRRLVLRMFVHNNNDSAKPKATKRKRSDAANKTLNAAAATVVKALVPVRSSSRRSGRLAAREPLDVDLEPVAVAAASAVAAPVGDVTSAVSSSVGPSDDGDAEVEAVVASVNTSGDSEPQAVNTVVKSTASELLDVTATAVTEAVTGSAGVADTEVSDREILVGVMCTTAEQGQPSVPVVCIETPSALANGVLHQETFY